MTSKACIFAEQAAPRYTSYPTAPHFTAAVGPETYAGWLEELPDEATLSLYLHVPFCAELCHYCGCHTKVVRRREPIEAYAGLLEREVDLLAARTAQQTVTSIHWGGGTPSMLGPDRLIALSDRLAAAFNCAPAEHAIELDPRHIDRPLVQALGKIGVTRASLGVQEFAPHVQHAIGRIQPFEQVAAGVGMLREAGIGNLNFDLMYGLPHQSADDIGRSISLAHQLTPSRIALFGYAHVPWLKTHQRLVDAAALPGASERLAQAEAAREMLVSLGYVPIGLDHFARPGDGLALAAAAGRLRRNFQGYTTDNADALLGIGASAIGGLPRGFVQNAPDIAGYARSVENGRLATVRGIAFTADDRQRGRIIERLMCDFAAELDDFGVDSAVAEALAPLAAEGLVTIDNRRVAMTQAGRPFVRLAAAAFDTYLGKGAARHSRAV
ncbi:MAG: oxygen-independent coproporphyrinogen III oxidase [Alphaproteobacteria bacterium]|nr:MAG: oxygen-independent coproporphyrinogen III oxidase [Alphaproteobacteria bacterium]